MREAAVKGLAHANAQPLAAGRQPLGRPASHCRRLASVWRKPGRGSRKRERSWASTQPHSSLAGGTTPPAQLGLPREHAIHHAQPFPCQLPSPWRPGKWAAARALKATFALHNVHG